MKDFRRPFWCASAVSALLLFAWIRAGIGDLDSPEIVASLYDMGQMHPPGHPSYMAAASLDLWLPFGTHAFRIAFFSFLCLVLTAGVVAEIVWSLRQGEKREELCWSALFIPVLVGSLSVLVPGVAEQGIRPEVYAFHLLLSSSALYCLLKLVDDGDDARWLLSVGILEGLALANHHYLTALALGPSTLWVVLRIKTKLFRRLKIASLGLFVGLLPYVALALKDPGQSDMFWADTSSVKGFWETISADAFQGSVASSGSAGFGENILLAFGMLWRFLGGVPFVLGLFGLGMVMRNKSAKSLILILVFLGAFLSKSIMFADPENPDDRGYLALAFILWIVFSGFCFYRAHDWFQNRAGTEQRKGLRSLWVLVGLALLGHSIFATSKMAVAEAKSAKMVRMMLEDIPPSSLVFSHYYQNHFLLQHALFSEGRRPDLVEAQMSMGGAKGQDVRAHFSQRHPEYADLMDAYGLENGFPMNHILDTHSGLSIALELEPGFWGLNLDQTVETERLNRELLTRSQPGFVFHALSGERVRSRCGFPRKIKDLRDLVVAPGGLGLKSQLGYIFLERTLFQIRRGDARCARQNIGYLEELAGESATLKKLEAFVVQLEASANEQGVVESRPLEQLAFPRL